MEQQQISTPQSQEDVPEVLVEEVEKAVKDMKSGKAVGKDGITAEILKYDGRATWKILARIYRNCLKTRKTGITPISS